MEVEPSEANELLKSRASEALQIFETIYTLADTNSKSINEFAADVKALSQRGQLVLNDNPFRKDYLER